jgi:peptide/nickel transport system ATP-binding protein/oligopeptide transport system ATP-binding protein
VPSPPGRIVEGSILLDAATCSTLREEQMCRVRGREISMIFQEPMTSLNPVFRIGEQIAEVIRLHRGAGRGEAMTPAWRCSGWSGFRRPTEGFTIIRTR